MRPEDALNNLSGQRPEDALGEPRPALLSNICGQRVGRAATPCQLKPGHLVRCGMSQEVEDEAARLKATNFGHLPPGFLNEPEPQMLDLRDTPLTIQVSSDGTVWVNGPTHCLLRASLCPELTIDIAGRAPVRVTGGS